MGSSSPRIGVKINNIWNHHLACVFDLGCTSARSFEIWILRIFKNVPILNLEQLGFDRNIWVFPKIGEKPQNGWFIMGKPYKKWMIWGYHYFWKHPYCLTISNSFLNWPPLWWCPLSVRTCSLGIFGKSWNRLACQWTSACFVNVKSQCASTSSIQHLPVPSNKHL